MKEITGVSAGYAAIYGVSTTYYDSTSALVSAGYGDISGSLDTSVSGSGIAMYSMTFGSDEFVSVTVTDGAFDTTDALGASATSDYGRNAAGVINGNSVSGNGNTIRFNSAGLDLKLSVTDGYLGTTSFTIAAGGGALFQLSPDVTVAGQINIGIDSITAAHLGSGAVGYLNSLATGGVNELSSGNLVNAAAIVDEALTDVTTLRGRLGAFQKNVIDTAIRSLRVTLENVSAAESLIRDVDFASETSEMTRSQIMVAAGTSVLAAANSSPQNVLTLLG